MIKYLQLPFHFDVMKMQFELTQLNNRIWTPHYQKLQYEGDWSALPLRSIDGNAENIYVSPLPNPVYANTVFLENAIYLKEVLSVFKCRLLGVRLLKLAPGALIKEHRDAELYYEKGEIRLHIPIITHEDVEFYLDKERLLLKEGECWYMNFNLPHSVHNKSKQPRIHLVIDALVNDWVTQLFCGNTLQRKDIEEPVLDIVTTQQIIAQLRLMNTATSKRLAEEMEQKLNKAN